MALADWEKNGWLRKHKSSTAEVENLMEIVERDLKDAGSKYLSNDWKFGIAYNAALKLCTILLHHSGYRPEKKLAHFRTLQAMPIILGKENQNDADYLDVCRKKRNETEYDVSGNVSQEEAEELIGYTLDLKKKVEEWLKTSKK